MDKVPTKEDTKHSKEEDQAPTKEENQPNNADNPNNDITCGNSINDIIGKSIGCGAFGLVHVLDQKEGDKTKDDKVIKLNLVPKELTGFCSTREYDCLLLFQKHPFFTKLREVYIPNQDISTEGKEIPDDNKLDKMHFILEKEKCDLYDYLYHGKPKISEIKTFFVHILLAIEYLHQEGWMHRDIKPLNILIHEEDGYKYARLCDFGSAKRKSDCIRDGMLVSTCWYRCPESALGYEWVTEKMDMWSLGCLLFEMLAKTPWIQPEDNSDEIVADIVKNLPQKCDISKYCKVLKVENMDVKYPRKYKSFIQQMDLEDSKKKSIEKSWGSLKQVEKLLQRLMTVNYKDRISAKDCLDDVIFDSHRDLIKLVRENYKLTPKPPLMLNPVPKEIKERIQYHMTKTTERHYFQLLDAIQIYHVYPKLDSMDLVKLFDACYYMAYKYHGDEYVDHSLEDFFDKKAIIDEAELLEFEKIYLSHVIKNKALVLENPVYLSMTKQHYNKCKIFIEKWLKIENPIDFMGLIK